MNKNHIARRGVSVIVKDLHGAMPVSCAHVKKAVLKTLSVEKIRKSGEITVILVKNRLIRELNLVYCGRLCRTDVLSFENSLDSKKFLADIAVCADTAVSNAKIYKTSFEYELYLYVIHGVLHLIGYDDQTRKRRKVMQRKAEDILKANLS